MTEFEYIEALVLNIDLVRNASMDFITVFFAYIVCAYIVGSKLQRSVAIATTILYSAFVIGPISGMVIGGRNGEILVAQALAAYPNNSYFVDYPINQGTVLFVIAPCLAWLVSLIYLHAVVRRTESHGET